MRNKFQGKGRNEKFLLSPFPSIIKEKWMTLSGRVDKNVSNFLNSSYSHFSSVGFHSAIITVAWATCCWATAPRGELPKKKCRDTKGEVRNLICIFLVCILMSNIFLVICLKHILISWAPNNLSVIHVEKRCMSGINKLA